MELDVQRSAGTPLDEGRKERHRYCLRDNNGGAFASQNSQVDQSHHFELCPGSAHFNMALSANGWADMPSLPAMRI